jgi:hypothetical protein
MRWEEFVRAAPELANRALERFEATRLSILGTNRRDGWPRISPCEVYVVRGELLLGMMWRSRKALDLIRDDRIAVHTPQCDREAAGGDVKLYGRASDVTDPALRVAYADTLQEAIDWRPTEPFNLFAVDIERASFISFGDGAEALRWTPVEGVVKLRHPDA